MKKRIDLKRTVVVANSSQSDRMFLRFQEQWLGDYNRVYRKVGFVEVQGYQLYNALQDKKLSWSFYGRPNQQGLYQVRTKLVQD